VISYIFYFATEPFLFKNLNINKIKVKKKIEWLEFSFEPEKRIHSKRQSNMISTGKPKQYISREMTPQWLKNNTYEPTTSKTSAYTEEERQAFLQKMKKKVKETQLFDENCKGSF
jgi:plasmid replication initiation protein